jgi:hypothetical protein
MLFVVPAVDGWKNCCNTVCIWSDVIGATYNLVLPRTATPLLMDHVSFKREYWQEPAYLELFLRKLHAYLRRPLRQTGKVLRAAVDISCQLYGRSLNKLTLDSWCCSMLFKSGACCLQMGQEYLACAEELSWRGVHYLTSLINGGDFGYGRRAKFITRTCPAFPPSLSARPAPPPPICIAHAWGEPTTKSRQQKRGTATGKWRPTLAVAAIVFFAISAAVLRKSHKACAKSQQIQRLLSEGLG